ncbi:MAG: hypothetical protein ABGY43_10060 [bacterium]|jgi:hypothetical protein
MCILALASVALSYYGQIQAGKAQKRQADYQAQVATNNAKIAEFQAQDALDRGRVREEQYRQKVSQLKGQQRAAFAASGVEVDRGSALGTLSDTAYFGELDALTIRSNAEREAYSNRVRASNFKAESTLLTFSGKDALRASKINAFSGAFTQLAGFSNQSATQQV